MVQPHRITAGSEYRTTVRRGYRVGGGFATAHAVFVCPKHPARFGFIVTKAVGNAVVRNRVRRRMKAISDELVRDGAIGFDVVFRAQPAAAAASYAELRTELRRQITRAARRHGIAPLAESGRTAERAADSASAAHPARTTDPSGAADPARTAATGAAPKPAAGPGPDAVTPQDRVAQP